MEVTVVGRRPTLALLVVLGSLFLLMSRNARTVREGETRTLLERATMAVFAPIPRTMNRIGTSTTEMFHSYFEMRHAVEENTQLRHRTDDLIRENLTLRRERGDLARIRALLSYAEQIETPSLYARVVMVDRSGRFKSIILDRGWEAGISVNDSVVDRRGLIGRVVLTTKNLAKVQLIIDPNAAVGCLDERTRRQGVVRGDGEGSLRLDYIPSLTDIVVDDRIVTAGIDGIHPKGIDVGTVTRVTEGKELFKVISVKPAVDFSTLEEVLILQTPKISQEIVGYQP